MRKWEHLKLLAGLTAVCILGATALFTACEDRVITPDPNPPAAPYCCPSWFSGDSLLMYADLSADSARGVWTVDTRTGDLSMALSGEAYFASYSMLSGKLVFERGGYIYLVDGSPAGLDTSTMLQLAGTGSSFFPSWSPDGEWIAYDEAICGGVVSCGIHIAKIDGTEFGFVVHGRMPDWSPDGSRILFSGPGYTVSTVSLDDTADVDTLFSFQEYLGQIAWSLHPSYAPDGKSIALEVRTFPGQSIWILDTTTWGAQRIASGATPAWSASGELLAFIGQGEEKQSGTVWTYNVKTGRFATVVVP